jgi:hypothetical protein
MKLGPTDYNRASRDLAVRTWLTGCSKRIRWWTSQTWKMIYLRDAYDHGYIHGYTDRGEDDAQGPDRM